ncbi:Uncharacterised protein [Actinomyces howellii]|uniref:Uncharacterized protein n=1 Tax=Actinomyces howellii TaxID=52771 RepID=A0A448HCX9_9ACTO|nr:Uncharacterised protein [Actinomyces howellii]
MIGAMAVLTSTLATKSMTGLSAAKGRATR